MAVFLLGLQVGNPCGESFNVIHQDVNQIIIYEWISLGVFEHLHAFLGASRVSMHLLVSNGAFDSGAQRMG